MMSGRGFSFVAVLLIAVLVPWYLGPGWTAKDVPDLKGKTALITGANSGLGFETAKIMAAKGCRVLMACRSMDRCDAAVRSLKESVPDAQLQPMLLDLAEPESVKQFAGEVQKAVPTLDYLINNAAIMAVPEQTNSKGWELQFATNHMGHFQLVQSLLPLLRASKARIVNHASTASHITFPFTHPVDLEDVMFQNGKREYDPWLAYGQTKRANLQFTYELNRRYGADGITATSCHPGYSATQLQHKATGNLAIHQVLINYGNPYVAMSPAIGALSQVHAAVAARPDEYIGPRFLMWGTPAYTGTSLAMIPYAWWPLTLLQAPDTPEDAKALWELSEKLAAA